MARPGLEPGTPRSSAVVSSRRPGWVPFERPLPFAQSSTVFLCPAALGAAVLVGATALVALRTAGLPRWAAWPSMVLALWLLIAPLGQGVDAPENPAPWTGLAVL
ncbi:MAG: hypothetical protein ACXVHB_29195, partial [Solirubrobacteraceae bacterium]